jgi:hypothetical protein
MDDILAAAGCKAEHGQLANSDLTCANRCC